MRLTAACVYVCTQQHQCTFAAHHYPLKHCTLTFNDNLIIYGMLFHSNLSSSNKSYCLLASLFHENDAQRLHTKEISERWPSIVTNNFFFFVHTLLLLAIASQKSPNNRKKRRWMNWMNKWMNACPCS